MLFILACLKGCERLILLGFLSLLVHWPKAAFLLGAYCGVLVTTGAYNVAVGYFACSVGRDW
jgi:hypothetical protein